MANLASQALNAGKEYMISLGVNMDTQALNKMLQFLTSGKLKAAAMAGAFQAASKALYKYLKSSYDTELEMQKMAKTQHKSVETIRAQQNALKAMGKTMQEVSKDPALKAMYNDLVKANKAMALPDMRGGISLLRQLQASFYELRAAVRYSMQWINYHMLANLKEPIQRITAFFKQVAEFIRKDINSLTAKLASYLTAFTKGLLGIVEMSVKIADWVHKLPDGIKSAGLAITAVFALLKSGPMGQIMAVITAVGGLIDDYENWQWNKANPDAEQVAVAFPSIWELLDSDDLSAGDKAKAVAGKLFDALKDALDGNALTLGALGASLFGGLFGGADLKLKLIAFIAGGIIGALLDPEVRKQISTFAEELWQSIIDEMPDWLKNLLGVTDSAHKEAQSTVGEPMYFDKNGNPITPYEFLTSSKEQQAEYLSHTPTDAEKEFANAYSYATNGKVDLYQSPSDLMPMLASPDGKMSAATTPAMAQWNSMWQTAIETKNAFLLRKLADVGGQWQSYVSTSKDPVTTQMVTDNLTSQLERLMPSAKSGLPIPNFADVMGYKQEVPLAVSKDAGKDLVNDLQDQVNNAGTVNVGVEFTTRSGGGVGAGKSAMSLLQKNAWGGRYDRPITTEVAEDGGTEYIIPLSKPARAFALIKQMLGEMGSAATQRLMTDMGLGMAGTNGANAATISSAASGATINNNYNISAPVTIQVTASGADAKEIGTTAYNAAERQLIRSLKGVLA